MTDYTGDQLEAHLQEETTNSAKWKVQDLSQKSDTYWAPLSSTMFPEMT